MRGRENKTTTRIVEMVECRIHGPYYDHVPGALFDYRNPGVIQQVQKPTGHRLVVVAHVSDGGYRDLCFDGRPSGKAVLA